MVSTFVKTFYERPAFGRRQPALGAGEVIRWWESRRLFFNLVVGCAGLISCFLMVVCAFTAESFVGEAIGMSDGPLLGAFFIFPYALLANVCYTGGWISELLMRTASRADSSAAFGLRAFRVGVTFSILVTLCPAALCWLAFFVALFKGQTHGPVFE
jgi:hypothetical protein